MNPHLLRQRDQLELFVRWKIADGSTLQEASELEFAFSLLVTRKNTSVIWPSSFSYSTLSNGQATNIPLPEDTAWNKRIRICRPEYGSDR